MKKIKKFYISEEGTFSTDCNFYFGDHVECVKELNKEGNVEIANALNDHDRSNGVFIRSSDACTIWVKSKGDIDVIAHEIFHLVCYYTRFYGIDLCNESEEVYAHMQSFYLKEVLKKLNEKEKKESKKEKSKR